MPVQRVKYGEKSNMTWTHFMESPLMPIQYLMIVITTYNSYTVSSTSNITFFYRENITEEFALLEHALTIFEPCIYFLQQKRTPKISKIDYIAIDGFEHRNIQTWGLILQR